MFLSAIHEFSSFPGNYGSRTAARNNTLCPVADAERWNRLVDASPVPDTYYRPEYVGASASGGKTAVGVIMAVRQRRFLVPLIIRPLAELEFAKGACGFDAITPYGYGGVLPLNEADITPDDSRELLTLLRRWCIEAGIVSCLVRLHPLTAQPELMKCAEDDGVVVQLHGETRAIDLHNWDEDRGVPLGLHPERRWNLNCARRELRTRVVPGGSREIEAALQTFRGIYTETMVRCDAADFYFFPSEYYSALARGLGNRLSVVLCCRGDDPAGAALFFADRLFAHYHLSGTTALGRKFKAATMMVIAGCRWARERGCRWLHLGGGNRAGDSLLHFKNSFGGAAFQYGFVKLIADYNRYGQLVAMRNRRTSLAPAKPGFFPAYRG